MRRIRVSYRKEPDGVWAESPDVPGYSAVGHSVEEVQALVAEGLPEFLGEPVHIVETEPPTLVEDLTRGLTRASERITESWNPPQTGVKSEIETSTRTLA